jgi:hypothetical protein
MPPGAGIPSAAALMAFAAAGLRVECAPADFQHNKPNTTLEDLVMVALSLLWLPILLAAVIVFIASSIIHMGPFWHRGDYPKLPNEERFRDAVRPLAIPPGEYLVPRASPQEARTPEYLEKLQQGPVMLLTVRPNGAYSMVKSLVLWFLYALVVGVFAAYVAGRVLPAGTEYLEVFRIAGATAFVGYAVALLQMSIWYWRSWGLTAKAVLDGVIYALLTAGVFGWLWP